jgi:hypothetical protein
VQIVCMIISVKQRQAFSAVRGKGRGLSAVGASAFAGVPLGPLYFPTQDVEVWEFMEFC